MTVLAVVAGVAALRLAQDVLMPLVLSILIGYALNPIVNTLMRIGLGRGIATAFLMLALLVSAGASVWYLTGPAAAILDDVPDAARKLRRSINQLRGNHGAMEKVKEAATEIQKTADQAVGGTGAAKSTPKVQLEKPDTLSEFLWSGSMGALTIAGQGLVVFFMVYFLLASGDLYKRKLVTIAGSTLSEKKVTVQILNEIESQIGRFLSVLLFSSVLVSVATSLVLWWFGVNQAVVWGVAAGVLNTIPYFGAIIVSAGLALVAFLQFGNLTQALYVSAVAGVITTIEGYLLTPMLMGKAMGINQVALFVGILFWSWLWGIPGMILAVPIMMALKAVCDRIEDLQPIAELLSDKGAEKSAEAQS